MGTAGYDGTSIAKRLNKLINSVDNAKHASVIFGLDLAGRKVNPQIKHEYLARVEVINRLMVTKRFGQLIYVPQ